MYKSIEAFEKDWKRESGNTSKCLEKLTDESLTCSVADDHRTLGRIAWHITTTIPELVSQTGLKLESLDKDAPLPSSASKIANSYRKAADELLAEIKSNWDDATLDIEDDLYGEMWKRGQTLAILINHEVHHRGQMTVLMRQAGLSVPGCYGPSKEEWSNFGGEPPAI